MLKPVKQHTNKALANPSLESSNNISNSNGRYNNSNTRYSNICCEEYSKNSIIAGKLSIFSEHDIKSQMTL